jgi:hypothetical protein
MFPAFYFILLMSDRCENISTYSVNFQTLCLGVQRAIVRLQTYLQTLNIENCEYCSSVKLV